MKNKIVLALLGIIAGSITQCVYSNSARASLEETIEFVDDYIKNNGEKITEQHRLLQAILKGNFDDAEKAIKNGAKVNYQQDKKSPLFYLVKREDSENSDEDVNTETENSDEYEKAEGFLLDLEYGTTLLAFAIIYKPEMVQFLLEHGANPNLSDYEGFTPLMFAADYNDNDDVTIIHLLLKFGANPNTRNSYDDPGYTALYYAVDNENRKVIDALLKNGANINLKYKDGQTLLHFIITGSNLVVGSGMLENDIKQLLVAGANPNITDDEGFTPLNEKMSYLKNQSVTEDDVAVIKLLLQFKANPNIADNENITPLKRAVDDKSIAIIEALLVGGANPGVLSTRDRNIMNKLLLKSSNTKKQKILK